MVNVGNVSVIRDGGSPKERARKLVEEAAEAFSAWERYDRAESWPEIKAAREEIAQECADVITAACGLLWSIYGGSIDIEPDMDACKRRNEKRGRVMV